MTLHLDGGYKNVSNEFIRILLNYYVDKKTYLKQVHQRYEKSKFSTIEYFKTVL